MSYPLPGSACGFNGTGSTDATANFRTTFQVLNRSVAFIGLELPGFPRDPKSCAVREAQVGQQRYSLAQVTPVFVYIASGFGTPGLLGFTLDKLHGSSARHLKAAASGKALGAPLDFNGSRSFALSAIANSDLV